MMCGLTVVMSLRGITERAVRGFFTDLDHVTQFTVCKQGHCSNLPSEGRPFPFTSREAH